jgi:SAM-dependent methyltransferase
MSGSHTPEELEGIYRNVVLKQDFYGETYGCDSSLEPHMELARVLCAAQAPKSHIDVGCGRGYFVAAMRHMGVKSFGLDFSTALIRQAMPGVQPYLMASSVENWLETTPLQEVELLSFMEVFEHLPFVTVGQLLEKLKGCFHGKLFLTVPSYGVDDRFLGGLQTNDGTPQWRADMMANRPFQNIVLADGVPHFGHISLASYRWWTEFFLLHGWVRCRDSEQRLFDAGSDVLYKHRWNPYILEQMGPPTASLDTAATNRLGAGWHHAETFGNRTGRWTNGNAQLFFNAGSNTPRSIELDLAAPDINVVRDWHVLLSVERLAYATPWRFQWLPLAVSAPVPLSDRGKTLHLAVEPVVLQRPPSPELQLTDVIRLSIISPSFRPKDYRLSEDPRQLGLIIHEANIRA